MTRVIAALLLVALSAIAQQAQAQQAQAAPPAAAPTMAAAKDDKPSPEEKMRRRFPQPVRVGDLIGLPVLDDDDSVIGYIRDVVRTPAGKIQLVVPYNPHLGWIRWDAVARRRLVAVPIETVVILGRQVDAVDMPPAAFDKAPTFKPGDATSIAPDTIIRIAIGRR